MRRAARIGAVLAAVLLVFALVAVVLLAPRLPGDEAALPTDDRGVEYRDLPTGSRLAYRHLAAAPAASADPAARTPVIVVGGGPGEAMTTDPSVAEGYRWVTGLGHEVYVYDQIGAGFSARLADPADYTVARHVADLDALRAALGAERVTLLGSSWGGSLSASYLAAHPARVERAVLTSPAPMDYAAWPEAGDVTARLAPGPRSAARALIPDHRRFLAWYLVGNISPRAARGFVGDREADAFFDEFLGHVRPATVCDPAHLPPTRATGNGLHTNVFTSADAKAGGQARVRQSLATNRTPVLVITGECNYIPWAPTAEYATTLPAATLVCLPGAGHVVALDRPELYREVVTAYLADRPGPLPATPPSRPCHA